jgi:two-component system sensor histidine kinase CreC
MKIRTRLIIGFLLITGCGLYYITDWIIKELRPNYLKAMEESLVDTATLLSSLVSAEGDSINCTYLAQAFSLAYRRCFEAKIYDVLKDNMNIRTYVTNASGVVIYDSKNLDIGKDFSSWRDVNLTLKGKYGARSTRTDPQNDKTSVLYVSSPIYLKNAIAGVLTVAKPADSVNLFINNAQTKIIITIIIAGFGVLLFGSLLSIWITVPIQRITEFARVLKKGKPKSVPKLHAIGLLGRNEMDELANALVEMHDALENKMYVENYVQTLTHELKSPLSAIRGASELIDEKMPIDERKRFLENITSETIRIQSMIERLLELSNLENRHGLKSIETLDIKDLLNNIIKSMEPICRKKGLSITLNSSCEIKVTAERFLLRQSIVNVLQNAIEFSPAESVIAVITDVEAPFVTIRIEDHGPGIPKYALPRIFDRFYSLPRPDSNLKSTGLGLSFVKEAVSLHGGTVHIQNRDEKGVTVILRWPFNPNAS